MKVLEKFGDGWWKVAIYLESQNKDLIGLYPSNYLQEESTNITKSKSQTSSFKTLTEQLFLNTAEITSNHDSNNPTKCESISSIDRDTEYVRVRHAFQAKKNNLNNELSVSVNEVLKLIEDDNELLDSDKSWLKVFNSRGLIGIIPSSCVEPTLDQQINSFKFVTLILKIQ